MAMSLPSRNAMVPMASASLIPAALVFASGAPAPNTVLTSAVRSAGETQNSPT